MWFFSSPQVVFAEGALSHLQTLRGSKACIITDRNLLQRGFPAKVQEYLPEGIQSAVFSDVEPDPSLDTVRQGAEFLQAQQPDWLIALGGGSVLDAAKAMWVLYECPEVDPASINPIEVYNLRRKARMVAIPTTTGTGSEATWAIVLTDTQERRKLGLGTREAIADIAILDPELVMELPARLTADTGLDALTHAIEGYTSVFHNDFSDGLCLNAARLVFKYLPQVYQNGTDLDARTHLQNAATLAGLGFGNSMAALAHGLGHALGGVFHVPHGRAVALFLPYTIEYCARGEASTLRYVELASFLGLPARDEAQAARSLVKAIRELEKEVGQPLNLRELGISLQDVKRELDLLADNALNDSQTVMSSRVPEYDEIKQLFLAAWYGKKITF